MAVSAYSTRGGMTGWMVLVTMPSRSSPRSVTVSILEVMPSMPRCSSVNTGEPNRDNHIRSADFFEVESHPHLTFRSTGIRPDGDNFLLDGDLTIRGTTKPVTLKLEVNGFGADPFGGTRSGFSASGEINRHDFGVSYNGPVPGGGVVVSEKVSITLEIEGVLNKPE